MSKFLIIVGIIAFIFLFTLPFINIEWTIVTIIGIPVAMLLIFIGIVTVVIKKGIYIYNKDLKGDIEFVTKGEYTFKNNDDTTYENQNKKKLSIKHKILICICSMVGMVLLIVYIYYKARDGISFSFSISLGPLIMGGIFLSAVYGKYRRIIEFKKNNEKIYKTKKNYTQKYTYKCEDVNEEDLKNMGHIMDFTGSVKKIVYYALNVRG